MEKVGLQSEFDNSQFEAGMAAYNAGIEEMSAGTDAAAQSMMAAFAPVGDGIATTAQAMTDALAQTGPAATEAAKGIEAVPEAAEKASAGMQVLNGIMQQAVGVFAGMGLMQAVGMLKNELMSFGTMAMQEEVGVQRLSAAVKASGANWEEASERIETYIASQARATALDDGAAREAMAKLTQVTGDYNTALSLMPAVQDMAAGTGMGLAQAGQLLARVQEGQVTILRRYGIVLAEGTSAEEALLAVRQKFAGQAEAYGATTQGQMDSLNVALGNLKETIGAGLLPVITPLIASLADLAINILPQVTAQTEATVASVQSAIGPITAVYNFVAPLVTKLQELQGAFLNMVNPVNSFKDALGQVANLSQMSTTNMGFIGQTIVGVAQGFETGKNAALGLAGQLVELAKGALGVQSTMPQMAAAFSTVTMAAVRMADSTRQSFGGMATSATANAAVINAQLGKAFNAAPVQSALAQLSSLTSAHTTKMAELVRANAAKIQDMRDKSDVKAVQGLQKYQMEYAGMMAAGRATDAAKLTQKFENESAVIEGELSYQVQLQEQALIAQQIQQQQSYIAQLEAQEYKVREALGMQILEAETSGKITHEAATTALEIVVGANNAMLMTEFETKRAQVQVAQEWAKGEIDAAVGVGKALAALEEAQFGAAGALAKLEAQQSSFQVKIPEMPKLDFTKIVEPKEVKEAKVKADRAGGDVSRAASEPVTKTMVEVVGEINNGVKAAQEAILGLVDFDVPEGWQAGLAKFGEWTKAAVESLYESILPLEAKAKPLAEAMESVGKIGGGISAMATALAGAVIPETAPDWTAWAKQVGDMLVATMAMITLVVGKLTTKELEEFGAMAETLGKVLALAGTSLEGVKAPAPGFEKDLVAYIDALMLASTALVTRLTTMAPEFKKAATKAAEIAPTVKTLADLLTVSFENVKAPKQTAETFDEYVETLMHVVTDLAIGLEMMAYEMGDESIAKAAKIAGNVQAITGLFSVTFDAIKAPPKKFFEAFIPWMDTLFEATRILVERVQGVDEPWMVMLEKAAKVVERVKGVADLLGVSLEGISMPRFSVLQDFDGWMIAVGEINKRLTLWLSRASEEWLDMMGWAATVGKGVADVMSILGVSLDSIKAPSRNVLRDFDLWQAAVGEINKRLVLWLSSASDGWVGLMGKAAIVSKGVTDVLSLLNVSLENVKAPPPGVMNNFTAWKDAVGKINFEMTTWLSRASSEWIGKMEIAGKVAALLKGIFDVFSISFEFKELPTLQLLSLEDRLNAFKVALSTVISSMNATFGEENLPLLEKMTNASAVLAKAKDIFAVLAASFEFKVLPTDQLVMLSSRLNTFKVALGMVIASMNLTFGEENAPLLAKMTNTSKVLALAKTILDILAVDMTKFVVPDLATLGQRITDFMSGLKTAIEIISDGIVGLPTKVQASVAAAALIAPNIKLVLDLLSFDPSKIKAMDAAEFDAQFSDWLSQMLGTAESIADSIDDYDEVWQVTWDTAKEMAPKLKAVLDLVSFDPSKIKAMDAAEFDAQFSDWLSQMLGTAESIADSIDDYDADWQVTWDTAKDMAPKIKAVLDLLSFDPTKVKRPNPKTFERDKTGWIASLLDMAKSLAIGIRDMDKDTRKALADVKEIVPNMRGVLDILSVKLEVEMPKLDWKARFTRWFEYLSEAIDVIRPELLEFRSKFASMDLMGEMATTAENLQKIFGVLSIKDILGKFTQTQGPTVKNLTAMMTSFKVALVGEDGKGGAMLIMHDTIGAINEAYGADLEEMKATVVLIEEIVGMFPTLGKAITDTWSAGGIHWEHLEVMSRQIAASARALATLGIGEGRFLGNDADYARPGFDVVSGGPATGQSAAASAGTTTIILKGHNLVGPDGNSLNFVRQVKLGETMDIALGQVYVTG